MQANKLDLSNCDYEHIMHECAYGMWLWYVVMVCGYGMCLWYVVMVCVYGMWLWYVVMLEKTPNVLYVFPQCQNFIVNMEF